MEKKMNRWPGAFIITLALVTISSPAFTEEKEPSKDKVAIVNGTEITKQDFNREVSRVQMHEFRMGTNLTDSKLLEIKQRVLENLIDQELIYQESQKKGIKVSEKAFNEQLMAIKKRFPNEAAFNSALKGINLTEATLKTQIRKKMAAEQFIDEEFGQKIEIADEETRSYYENHPNMFIKPEQVRASHILIKVNPHANETQEAESKKKLEQIKQRLQKGEDFASLAKAVSEGPSSAEGGDLGYFRRGQMVKAFEDVAFALKPGEVSDIVKTRFGYHLIKVVDKKPESKIPYEEIKDRIEIYLKRGKIQKKVSLYVEKLKEKAKVERIPIKDL